MLAPNAHRKFQDNNRQKVYYFNKDHTYRVIYAFTGCLTEEQIRASFMDALGQLKQKFPHMVRRVDSCKIMINLPYKSNFNEKGEIKYNYMDYAYIFVSDWEIGNAICGFNFDGTVRIKVVSVDDGIEMTTEEIIKKRYEGNDSVLTEKELADNKKKYMKCMNAISETNIESSRSTLNSSVGNYESLLYVVNTLITAIIAGKWETKLQGLLFKPLIDSELSANIKEADEDSTSVSLVYRTICEELNRCETKLFSAEDSENWDKKKAVNFYELLGFLFTDGTIHENTFMAFANRLMKDIDYEKNTTEIFFRLDCFVSLLRNTGQYFKHHPEMSRIKEIVEDMDNPRIKTVFQKACDELDKSAKLNLDNSYSEKCKFVQLEPICFLPATLLKGKMLEELRAYAKDRKYEECLDTIQYAGIRALFGCVYMVEDVERNVLISNNLPSWVDIKELENRLKPFATSTRKCDRVGKTKDGREQFYPLFSEKSFEHGTKKFFITFDPDTKHINDAAFANLVFKKFVLFNKKSPNEFTEVVLEFKKKM